MELAHLQTLINSNQPFRVETVAGRIFDIPSRDFVMLTPKRKSLFVAYEENGKESFAVLPLATISSAATY